MKPPGGIAAVTAACVVWGVLPLYVGLLTYLPAAEFLSYRVVWAAVVSVPIALVLGARPAGLAAAAADPRLWAASLLIGVNWLVFIRAVQAGKVLETSLGYFVSPLFSFVLGCVVFGERPGARRLAAVGLAATGVGVSAVSGAGVPTTALLLAGSFALYGALKKRSSDVRTSGTTGGAVAAAAGGIAVESALLVPFALVYLLAFRWGAAGPAAAAPVHGAAVTQLLLAGSGLLTVVPLLLYSYAASRLELSVLGVMTYLAPSISFVAAVVVLGEPFDAPRLTCFLFIWAGLALFLTSPSPRPSLSGPGAHGGPPRAGDSGAGGDVPPAVRLLRSAHGLVFFYLMGGSLLPSDLLVAAHVLAVPAAYLHWKTNRDTCVLTEWEEKLAGGARHGEALRGAFTKRLLSNCFDPLPPDRTIKIWFHGLLWGSWGLSVVRTATEVFS